MHRVYSPQRGIETKVSEPARPSGRGRSEFAKFWSVFLAWVVFLGWASLVKSRDMEFWVFQCEEIKRTTHPSSMRT